MSKQLIRPYGDTTGDGMVQVSLHAADSAGKGAEGSAAQLANKMGIDPAMVVHAKPMGPDFTFFVVYGRVNHLVDPQGGGGRARLPAAAAQGGEPRHQAALRRRLVVVGAASAPMPTRWASTRSSTSRGSRGEGPGVLPRAQGRQPRRAGPVPELVARGPTREGRRGAGLAGGHPARRSPAQHPGDVRGVPRGLPAGRRPVLVVGGPRFDETRAAELGVDRVFGRGTTPGDVASYLVHRARRHHAGGLMSAAARADASTHRR